MKELLRDLAPPLLGKTKRALWGWKWFRGTYWSWGEARKQSGGYDQPDIVRKVIDAVNIVQSGQAAYERDSVLFRDTVVEADLLACLLQIAAENSGKLRVLDFGGSLGSTYWQHRHQLRGLKELRWDVVEQPHFVAAGREHVKERPMNFYLTLEEAAAAAPHDVLLASGVVHCLPSPTAFLDKFIATRLPFLLFNNLPLHGGPRDYLKVQHVPPEIYAASYPVWFLSREVFFEKFAGAYDVERTFASAAVWSLGFRNFASTGVLFRRSGAVAP